MSEWLNTTQQIISLVIGLVGLISSGVGVFIAIKNVMANLKDKTLKELWTTIMTWADAGMKAAETSGKKGEDKKQMVIEAVNASAAAAGVDISAFTPQLVAYIEQTIGFVNDMNSAKEDK